MQIVSAIVGLTVLVLVIGFYFLPGIVACSRNHKNKDAILILNLLLGWTFLGWVAALVWANTSHVEE